MSKQCYASYNNSWDEFTYGAFDTVEEAKAEVIDEYLGDLSCGETPESLPNQFEVGELVDIRIVAKRGLKGDSKSMLEYLNSWLSDSIDFDGDESILYNDYNIALLEKLLSEFYDNCEYGLNGLIENVKTFKFSEVINNDIN